MNQCEDKKIKQLEQINKLREIFADKSICLISRFQIKKTLRKNNIEFSNTDIRKLLKIFCGDPVTTGDLEIKLVPILKKRVSELEKEKDCHIPF